MKNFLKLTFVFGICIRLVLFSVQAKAGGPSEACCEAIDSYDRVVRVCERKLPMPVRLHPSICRDAIARADDRVAEECGMGEVERLVNELECIDIRLRELEEQPGRQGYDTEGKSSFYDYEIGDNGGNPFADSHKSKPSTNPFDREYTTEECCKALSAYHQRNPKFCTVFESVSDCYERLRDRVEERCDADPDGLLRHHWIENMCQDQ